jgi:AAA15 family ATPase/GTPase
MEELKLKSLYVKNFRCLEDLTVEKLGHVNLIVGGNNTGKSTVLEAIRIYAGNGGIGLLQKIATERHELFPVPENEVIRNQDKKPLEDFFSGRSFPENDDAIQISKAIDSEDALKIKDVYVYEEKEAVPDALSDEPVLRIRRRFALKHQLSGVETDIQPSLRVIKGTVARSYLLDMVRYNKPLPLYFDEDTIIPCGYVPTGLIHPTELASDWSREIDASPHEDSIVKTFGMLGRDEEVIEKIGFLEGESRSFRVPHVWISNTNQRVPLKSMGEGMMRMLQLAIRAVTAKGGFLLIDEFENGLHYSVQTKVWEWLFTLSKELDIQIFATTHSWDVIESFREVALDRNDREGVLVSMGRSARTSDNGKIIATVYDEEKLALLKRTQIDPR